MSQWLLIVYNGAGHNRLLQTMQLKQSSKPDQWIGFYQLNQKDRLLNHIEALKKQGLHGIARKVEDQPRRHTRNQHRPWQAPKGFPQDDPLKRAHEARKQAHQRRQRDSQDHVKNVLRRARGD